MPSAASTTSPGPVRSIIAAVLLVIAFLGLVLMAGVARAAAPARSPTLLVLGDSLSAAYGIRSDQGWVALLQARLQSKGYGHRVVNASSSGETTGGALARLPRLLETHRPAIVVVELGGNDGLRGLPVVDLRRNLEAIVQQSRKAGAKVLLLGMKIPPNYGPVYARDFERVFADVAVKHGLAKPPFLLQDVALDLDLMQEDGIHPTAEAQPKLLERVWPALQPLL